MSFANLTSADIAKLARRGITIKRQQGVSIPDRAIVVKPARAKRGTGAKSQAKAASLHEMRFARIWQDIAGPELTEQYRFHKDRKWRFDFAHVGSKVAFELHGGTFTQGRHTRGKGFENDREKMNEAALAGWTVFELTAAQIATPLLSSFVVYIAGKMLSPANEVKS